MAVRQTRLPKRHPNRELLIILYSPKQLDILSSTLWSVLPTKLFRVKPSDDRTFLSLSFEMFFFHIRKSEAVMALALLDAYE